MINQIRGFLLERGIAVRQGLRFLRQQLPEILAKRIDVLSPRMIRMVEDLSGDWRHFDERIEQVTDEIEVLARESESCRQLMTVPGIGPLMVAAIVNGAAFTKDATLPPGSATELCRRIVADVHSRSDDPWPHQQAWQSLSAHVIHARRPSHFAQASKLGKA